MAFIIDGSGSIEMSGKGNYKKVLNFVKELTRAFDVSKDGTHIGLVSYDSEAKVGLVSFNRIDTLVLNLSLNYQRHPCWQTENWENLTENCHACYCSITLQKLKLVLASIETIKQ